MKYLLLIISLALLSCKSDSTPATAATSSSKEATQKSESPPALSKAQQERQRLIDALDQELTTKCFSEVTNRFLLRFYIYPDGHTDGWKFINGKVIKDNAAVTEAMACALNMIKSTNPNLGADKTAKAKKTHFIKIN